MYCPNCGEKTRVYDSSNAPEEVYRKRKCESCGTNICTIEYEVENNDAFKKAWAKYNRAWGTRDRKKKKEKMNEN